MSRYQRDKGARFERLVARVMSLRLSVSYRQDVEVSRVSVQGRLDSEHADISSRRYFIECKKRNKLAIMRWWSKVRFNADENSKIPLLVIAEDRGEPLVIMSIDEFCRLQNNNVPYEDWSK